MSAEILFLGWVGFVTIVPGVLILLLVSKCRHSSREGSSLLSSVLLAVALSYVFVAVAGYFLDLTFGLSWYGYLIITLVFAASVTLLYRQSLLLLFRTWWKGATIPRRIRRHAFSLVVLASVIIFVALPSLNGQFLYPSDPFLNLFKGRIAAANQHLALQYPLDARVWPLGLYYLLGVIFSFNIHLSLDFARLIGPFWGVLTILAVYGLAQKMTSSRAAASFAALIMGTYYIWVFLISQKGLIAQTIATFLMIVSLSLVMDTMRKKRGAPLLLSFMLGGMLLYHPPTVALLLLPILVWVAWHLVRSRNPVSLRKALQVVSIFFLTSSAYLLLLTPRSIEYRIGTPLLSPYPPPVLSLDYLFVHPFLDFGGGIIPISFFALGVVGYLAMRSHSRENPNEARKGMLEIVLLIFVIGYLYYVNPISELRSLFDPERMVIYLAVPMSLLAANGLDWLKSRSLNHDGKLCLPFAPVPGRHSRLTLPRSSVPLLLISLLFLGQFYLGVSRYVGAWHGYELYNGVATEDEWNMVVWVERFTPSRARILVDDSTGGLRANWTVGIHYYNPAVYTPIANRGLAWIAIGMLAPRDIIGNHDAFRESEDSGDINGLTQFYESNGIDYIILTRSEEFPFVVTAMWSFVIHAEGTILLFDVAATELA